MYRTRPGERAAHLLVDRPGGIAARASTPFTSEGAVAKFSPRSATPGTAS